MFNVEQSIVNWRKQMLAAGIKTPVPLEELEIHLREEIDRQTKSGLDAPRAFDAAVLRIGQAKTLKNEFKKIERTSMKKMGIFAVLIGAAMILRILTEHPDAAHLRKNEQVEWLITGTAIVLFGLGATFFIKLGDPRDISLWKLVGIIYSIFAVWICTVPIYLFLNVPRFSAAVDLTDRILTFAAVTVSLLSVFGWRLIRGILPLIQNRRTRTAIGIVCCILGPVSVTLFWFFIVPRLRHFAAAPFTLAMTAMAILGGVGYGLAEAARRQTETVDS
jgi:hypothetical protein